MSECERFAQVAQDKWATVSESLRSLMTNEQMWAFPSGRSGQMSELLGFFEQIAHFSFAHNKWAIPSKKFKRLYFVYVFNIFLNFFKEAKDSLISSERSERIAQVAQDKWAIMSDSLRSLRRNERSWANHSGRSPKMSRAKLRNLMSEFPTLEGPKMYTIPLLGSDFCLTEISHVRYQRFEIL